MSNVLKSYKNVNALARDLSRLGSDQLTKKDHKLLKQIPANTQLDLLDNALVAHISDTHKKVFTSYGTGLLALQVMRG